MKFVNEKLGISLEVPEGWTAKNGEGDESVVVKPQGVDFGPNVTITAAEIYPELSLHSGGIDFFQSLLKDEVGLAEFGNEEAFTLNGREAIAFNLAYAHDTDEGEPIHVTKMMVYVKEGGRVVAIAGTTTPDDFEERYPTFRDVAASVDFL
ncbi:MAG: hypothetical protein ACTSU5_02370 [Promethearchaeota archaeon]